MVSCYAWAIKSMHVELRELCGGVQLEPCDGGVGESISAVIFDGMCLGIVSDGWTGMGGGFDFEVVFGVGRLGA
jgi:hypothetical protein